MDNLDYNIIFKAAYEMVHLLNPIKSEADVHYFKNQEEELFDNYFKETIMSKKVNLQGHHNGQFDGKTLQEIKNEFEYEYLTTRCCDQIKFAISYSLFGEIMKKLEDLKTDTEQTVQNTIVKEFINSLNSSFLTSDSYCFTCGISAKVSLKKGVFSNIVDADSRMARFSGHHACKFSKGLHDYSHKLDIPSGKLMFANDLRCLFPEVVHMDTAYITEKSGYSNDINSEVGVMYNKEFWNNHGMIYVQTGSTSPHIFKDKISNVISVKFKHLYVKEADMANYEQDEDEDDGCVKNYTATEQDFGRITTDLWAVCGIDYNLMKTLCDKHSIDFDELADDCICVDVEPGQYEVRSFNAARERRKNTFFDVIKA